MGEVITENLLKRSGRKLEMLCDELSFNEFFLVEGKNITPCELRIAGKDEGNNFKPKDNTVEDKAIV